MKLTEVTHKQPEALTDEQWDTILVVLANAIRWSWVPTTTVMHMKAELARRPAPAPEPVEYEQISSREWVPKSPAPEPDSAFGTMVDKARIPQPAPQQDDAAVRKESK